MKRRLLMVALVLSAFAGGRLSVRPVDEARAITAYVEDCTLADAHAERCTIPCGGDMDCLEKNGSRDAY